MSGNMQKGLAAVVGVAALAVGGSAIAGAATKGSSTTTTTTTTLSGSSSSSSRARPAMPAPGTAAHEDAEKPVTGSAAETAKAAALAAVGSGTAGEVTTDYFGTGYEVTVTKSDGTTVEIHLDSSFNAMQGPPAGGAGPPGAPGSA
jgi:hypothetical protein